MSDVANAIMQKYHIAAVLLNGSVHNEYTAAKEHKTATNQVRSDRDMGKPGGHSAAKCSEHPRRNLRTGPAW